MRKYPSGITMPIDVEAADAIRQGRRKQRAGLCYEEHGFDGFSFCTWPHVFAAPASGSGHHDAMLHGPSGIADATRVSVIYEATPDPKLIGVAEVFWDAHKPCRETDTSAGGMVGVGEHLRRDGHVANFIVTDAAARARVAAGMEQAGKAFSRRWTGAHVEFEQLLENQDRLWGAKSRRACRSGVVDHLLMDVLELPARALERGARKPVEGAHGERALLRDLLDLK